MTSEGASSNNPGANSTTTSTLIFAVADATESCPYDLPALNETVDPDALNTLFEPADDPAMNATADEPPTAVVALEIDGVVATVASDGAISVHEQSSVSDALGVISDATLTITHYDWDSPQSVLSTVVPLIATETDADPVAVRDAINGILNQNALDTLFHSRENGIPRGEGGLRVPFREYDVMILSDGMVAVQPTLTRINRTGGNLLVVGSVPHEVSEVTSRALLGSADDRARIVAVHGHAAEMAVDWLDEIGAAPSRSLVVDYGDGSRSAAAMEAASHQIPIRPVAGDLDALAAELVDAVATLAEACDGLAPGQLRVCLDSLRSIQSQHEPETVYRFLETVTNRIHQASGIAHYVILADRTSDRVRAVEDLFDVIVELRIGADGPEQSWHIRETGHSTEWLQIDADKNEL